MDFTDRVATTTQERLLPSVVDNLLNSNILVVRTMQRPKMWDGKTLDRAIKIAKSSTGGSFGAGATFETGLVETRIKLSYKPKAFYQSVTLDGIEDAVNQTEAGVISLMKLTLEEAENDASDSLGDIAYGTGPGDDFEGTGRLNDDGTLADSVGGQSRATYPQLKGTKTALSTSLTLYDMAGLMKGVGAAGSRKQRPTLGIGDEDAWNIYEGLLMPTVSANYNANGYPQVTSSTRNGQSVPEASLNGTMGFNSVTYRGMPIVADEKAPANEIQFLNENYFDFYTLKSRKLQNIALGAKLVDGVYQENNMPSVFQWTGLKTPTKQFAEVGQLICMGNYATWQPRRHGRLTNVTS